jgi:phosphopantothenate synthetase
MAIVVQLPEGEARFVAVDLEPLSVAAWSHSIPIVQFDLRHVLRAVLRGHVFQETAIP